MGRSSGGVQEGLKEMEQPDPPLLDQDEEGEGGEGEEGGEGGKSVNERGRMDEEKGEFMNRTISLDFQLTDIQQLQKTIRSMSDDQSSGCCPSLFERASYTWWSPRFDSDILEGQFWRSTFPRTTRRFQFGLAYLLLLCLTWAIYFPVVATPHWYMFLVSSLSAGTIVFLMFLVTVTPLYTKHCFKVSFLLCVLLCSLSLLVYLNLPIAEVRNGSTEGFSTNLSLHNQKSLYGFEDLTKQEYIQLISSNTLGTTDISEAGLFALYVEVLLLVYTVIPLPLYLTLLVGFSYTCLFEIVAVTRLPARNYMTMIVQVLLHICVHVIGCHILIMTQVRMRDTFMKVGQSLLVKRQLGMEKQLKEKMIHSVMPPKVADWLMKGGHGGDEDEDMDIDSETGSMMRKISSPRSSNQGDLRTMFRPFNMNAMDNVSILFADIVGFTKMSTNKTASQLVGLLNDLFGRFDRLCLCCSCEKISTLGDCYYCVSGCPEPTPDHAANCVEMGLSMIKAIKEFDEDCNESVNMRVGIHTGTVLCGIVGKKMFKFDVWSNDVTLANKLESTGEPGRVHISAKTYAFLVEDYFVQPGEKFKDVDTFFITGRKPTSVYQLRADTQIKDQAVNNNNTQKIKLREITPNGTKSLPALGTVGSEGEGKVINKLYKFMRQRSAPSDGCCTPVLLSQSSYNDRFITIPEISKSEGSTPARDLRDSMESTENSSQPGEGSTSNPEQGSSSHPEQSSSSMSHAVSTPAHLDPPCSRPTLDQPCSIPTLDQPSCSSEYNLDSKKKVDLVPCPLVSMDSEFDIVPGERSPIPDSIDNGSRAPDLEPGPLRAPDIESGLMKVPELGLRGGRRDSTAAEKRNDYKNSIHDNPLHSLILEGDISQAYSRESKSDDNDLAVTYQEVHSVHFSGMEGPASLSHSISKFHQLRKQSDLVMIKSVQEDASHHHYFTKPPLHPLSLFFLDPSIESEYRKTGWKSKHNISEHEETTLATSSFNAYFDILVSGLVFMVTCIACFVQYKPGDIWVAICLVAAAYHLLVVAVCIKQMVDPSQTRSRFRDMYSWCRSWYPSQVFGAFLVSLPVVSVIGNLTCQNLDIYTDTSRNYFLNLLTVSIVHFCNFNQLYCYVKSILASIFTGCILVFLAAPGCPCPATAFNTTGSGLESGCKQVYDTFLGELALNITLLLVLLWLLCREFEISYRLSFHCSLLAARDKKKVLNLKNQADWLLHNIIPKHVSEQLKKSAKYSENHKDVGVVFATLVNFNELYDESYMGGKEYLRVLNELISDFDELLDKPEFRNIEKIKTIGATFMAASGLNPHIRGENHHKYQHLQELMEFTFSLQRVVEDFNQSLIEFDLVLRVGFNYGDVTSGVIGTTKLYYDIWGDAVNIASRMDSTGVDGRIQVNERAKDVLKQWYEFEERGQIFVKGKDNMTVFLFVKVKESAYRLF